MSTFKNSKPVIAIDGTAGSGKGTLAKNLSKNLNFDHLDTGLLYRIYAYESKQSKIDDSILNINLKKIFDDKNILKKLRSEEISKIASQISKKREVRKSLVDFQRNFANNPPGGIGSVIDGRDIGTVIIPEAEVKFFIDAKVEIRAFRRISQLNLNDSDYEYTLKNIIKRDISDSTRKISPLVRAKDSYKIDTSKLNQNEVLKIALDFIKKKQILFSNCI